MVVVCGCAGVKHMDASVLRGFATLKDREESVEFVVKEGCDLKKDGQLACAARWRRREPLCS